MQLLFCCMLIGSNRFNPTKHIQTDSAAQTRMQKKKTPNEIKHIVYKKYLPRIEISESNIDQPEGSISVQGPYSHVLNSLGVLR